MARRSRYNRKETVTYGHAALSIKNKIKKATQARAEGDYDAAQQILDDMEYIFQNDVIDLNQATPVISNKWTAHDARIEDKRVTQLLTKLHSDNFFQVASNTGFTANSAIEKAIDFNNKIVYNQQGVMSFASYTNVVKSYEKLEELKKRGTGNYLYLFDTETIGGKNKSNIWNPLGITEYASQKVDLGTGQVTKTNIAMGIRDTVDNRDKVEKILNALGDTLNDDITSAKLTNDASIILNNEELRVTAYRLAIYGDTDSVFEYDEELGYMKAKSLASSDINDWLDPKKIKKGWEKNVAASKAAGTTEYGLNRAELAFIDDVADMWSNAKADKAIIGGQNIVPFDFKVVNTEIHRLYKMLETAEQTGGINGISAVDAREGMKYIKSKFGGNIGIDVPSENIFDTLPMIQFIRDKFGVDALYKGNQEAIAAAGKGTAKQENIGAVWFPDLFASGEAHMADFDVDVQRNLFTTPIPELGDKTFIQHFMTAEQGGGLVGLNIQAQTIKAGNEQQLLYAKKGTRDRTFGGKAGLDFTRNRRTGEIFTSTNYEIMGINNRPEFKGDINMGTHINKGQFYWVDSIKELDAADISKDLGDVLPELSGPKVYQVTMRMAVADEYKGRDLEDIEYVMHFGSEYELSGWFSSNYEMPIVKNDAGEYVLNGNNALDILEKVKVVDGELIRPDGNYLGAPKDLMQEVVGNANRKALTDNTLRDLSDPNNFHKRIEKQLKIRKRLAKEGLTDVTQDEIADILHGKAISRMESMDNKQINKILEDVYNLAGFVDKKTNDPKTYSNSVRKLITAWDFVGAQDEFYMNVFDNLEKQAQARHWTNKQRDYMFNRVVENLKTQVADQMFDDPKKIQQAVMNIKDYEGTLYEMQNIFDIELPDNFIIEESKRKAIETGTSLNASKNILTVRLGDNASPHKLEEALSNMKFGARDTKMNPEHYKRMAMQDFVNHLITLDDFKDNDNILKAIEHINADNKTFNTTTVATNIIDAMKEVKAQDPAKGILKDINVRGFFEGDDAYNAAMNALENSRIIQAINDTPVPLDLVNVKSADRINVIQDYIKNNVLKSYLPSRKEFEDTLTGLNKMQKWQKTTLYNILEEQITNSLVDITDALSQVPNSEFMVMPDGRFVFKQGAEAITVDSIPKIKLDGDTLYGQVGRSNVQVHMDFEIKDGKVILSSNLGEAYTKNKAVTNRIRREVEEGTFKMESVSRITSHLSEKFRQDSRYEFKSGDWYSNFYVGTGKLQTMLPDMFSYNGKLKDLGAKVNLTDKERQVLADAFKYAREVKPGELDPQMNQYLSAYWIDIIQTITDDRGTDMARQLSKTLTIGTKGKGKLETGKLMGSNMRFATGFANSLDNLGRPVVDGSGNVKFIRNNQVKEAANRARGLFYDGAIFESIETDHLNKKIANGVGELTTGWTSRTAYVGEMGLKSILQNNFDTVMNNNSVKKLADEKKRNIYDMMFAYVNTFEQQKVADARMFDTITGGNLSANTIKLSTAKDFINIPKEEKLLHADKYERLLNLMGDVKIDPDGVMTYKESIGDIVRQGDSIIPFATYGGGSTEWTSKMSRGLLRFQVFNEQGVALTEDEINAVLKEKSHLFKAVNKDNKAERMKAFLDALEDYEVNFTVEDINRTTLPKILANDSEKSMNHLLYAKTGTIDEKVANVFRYYSDETAELLQGTVLTRNALEAYFNNTSKRRIVAKQAGFKSWGHFVKAWENEMYTMTDVLFGKGGIFEGFTDIANDNLLGHGNAGTTLLGSLNETVAMLGKYSSTNKKESQKSLELGFQKFVDIYNKETVDAQGNRVYANRFFKNAKGEGIGIELVNGRLRLEGGRALDLSLENSDSVNYEALENLVREANDFLVQKGATKEDRLIHKLKQVDEGDRYVFYVDEDEGKEYFGRMIYGKRDGKDIVEGSIGSLYKKIVLDPETQSSMPQEYFDTKMEYMKAKAQKINLERRYEDLQKEYKKTGSVNQEEYKYVQEELLKVNSDLANMDEYLKNMESTGHAFRIGDQEEKIIKSYFINADRFDHIDERIAAGELSRETVASSSLLQSIDRTKYKGKEGDIVYQSLIDELHKQRYYNPYIDTKELTGNMVELEKYKHLKPIYDNIVGSGQSDILGLESAELIHDLQMAKLADEFNNANKDVDKLLDAGFIEMTPKEYIDQFGDPNLPKYDSVYKQNVLLRMDMMDGTDAKYVAVPGMGSVLDEAEIKQDWHKHAGKLARTYQEEFVDAHMDPNKVDGILEKMARYERDLNKSTANYMEKGSEFHKRMKQEVHAATDRVKIISTMGDPNNPLLKQAQFDGRSLAEWIEDGVYVDYTFDSLESFQKRGYFSKKVLAEMNMTKEEMIEHLRTKGTMMIDDRFPNIRKRSLTPVRHYLAIDNQGMSFLANNATMMAPWTMLAMNADSDGDSVSRFLAKHDNIDHVEYGVARTRAVKSVESVAENASLDAKAKEELIRKETISIMKNDFGIKEDGLAEEAYHVFHNREVEMMLTATTKNKDWYAEVVKTWKSDSEKTVKAMVLKDEKGYTGVEVAGGRSIFGYTKFTALTETPTWDLVRQNMDDVNTALATIQNNVANLSKETQEYAKDLLEGSADIFSHNNENKILDQALVAMNELANNPNTVVNSTGFANFQEAAKLRSRINKYHIEGMKKLGVTATGNVNSTLYGISQAIKSRHGDINSPLYDEIMNSITSDMAYWLEESPISNKKLETKAGDLRIIEFGKVFRDMRDKGPTDEVVENMQNYFKTYMDHGQIIDSYNKMVDSARVPKAKRLTEDAKKVDYMVERFTNYISQALDKDSPLYAEVQGHSNAGRKTVRPGIANELGNQLESGTNLGDVINDLNNTHNKGRMNNKIAQENAEEVARRTTQAFSVPKTTPNARIASEVVESASNKISKSLLGGSGGLKKSLGLGVVGLAAGLIASGYASGNPLNDPDPATIEQKGFKGVQAAPEMMFSSGQGFAPNNTGGYIINIKGDTRKGNRQLKKALKQATRNAVGPSNVTMNVKTTQSQGTYSDKDIENILNNYF